jgi:hypothetical protein
MCWSFDSLLRGRPSDVVALLELFYGRLFDFEMINRRFDDLRDLLKVQAMILRIVDDPALRDEYYAMLLTSVALPDPIERRVAMAGIDRLGSEVPKAVMHSFVSVLLQRFSNVGFIESEYATFLEFIGASMTKDWPEIGDIGMSLLQEIMDNANPVINESNFDFFFDSFLALAVRSVYQNSEWHHNVLFPFLVKKLNDQPLFMSSEIFALFAKCFRRAILTHNETVQVVRVGLEHLTNIEYQSETHSIIFCFICAFSASPDVADLFVANCQIVLDKWI